MTILMRSLVLAAAALLVPGLAQAQYAPSPSPYATPVAGAYAVEVAPNTYVIHRPGQSGRYPYVRCVEGCARPTHAPVYRAAPHRAARAAVARAVRNDPALVEELRQHQAARQNGAVVNTTRIVRDKPVVIEHQRVVDDPPRIVERRHYVDDEAAERQPAPPARTASIELGAKPAHAPGKSKSKSKGKPGPRVIRAEAEVTILGPDRMSIRLFRKRGAAATADGDHHFDR
jgi:hypothetical protein